jgi:hypothetical protein
VAESQVLQERKIEVRVIRSDISRFSGGTLITTRMN